MSCPTTVKPLHYPASYNWNKSRCELIAQLYFVLDDIPGDFFPVFDDVYARAAYILEQEQITDLASAEKASGDLLIIYILTYVNQDLVAIGKAGKLLIADLQAEYDKLITWKNQTITTPYNAREQFSYTRNGLDYGVALLNGGRYPVPDVQFRTDITQGWIPFTLFHYFYYCWGWGASPTPPQTPLTPSPIAAAAQSVTLVDPTGTKSAVTIPHLQFTNTFTDDVSRLQNDGYLQGAGLVPDLALKLVNDPLSPLNQKALGLWLNDGGFESVQGILPYINILLAVLTSIFAPATNPQKLRRMLWMHIAAVLFGWEPIERWFIDYNIWAELPAPYKSPNPPPFNEYITQIFQGSPYTCPPSRPTRKMGGCPTRGRGRGRGRPRK